MGINKEKYFSYVQEYFLKFNCELLTEYKDFIDNKTNNLLFICSCKKIQNNINFKWYSREVHKVCNTCKKLNHKSRIVNFNKIIEYF